MAKVPAEIPLVTSYRTIAHSAADRGWLRNVVDAFLDPENDLVARLSRRRDIWLRLRYREPEIRMAFESLINPVLASEWHVVPAIGDDSSEAATETRQLTSLLNLSPGFRKAMAGLAEIIFRGHGGVELRGKLGGFGDVTKGEPLIPDANEIPSFALTYATDSGEPRLLLRGEDLIAGVSIRKPAWRWKFCIGHFGSTEGGNWFGSGLGVSLFYLYVFLTQSTRDWLSANERFAAPIPVGKVDSGDYTEQAVVIDRIFKSLVSGQIAGLTEPKGITFRLLNEAARSWPNYEGLDDRLRKTIHRAVLGQSGTTDTGDHGTFGAVRVQAKQLTSRQWQVAQFLQDIGTEQIIGPATEFLFGQRRNYMLEAKFDDELEPAERRDGLRLAAELGLPAKEEEVYEVVALTPPGDGEDNVIKLGLATAAPGGDLLPFAEDEVGKAERKKDLTTDEDKRRERMERGTDEIVTQIAKDATRELGRKIRARSKEALGKAVGSAP